MPKQRKLTYKQLKAQYAKWQNVYKHWQSTEPKNKDSRSYIAWKNREPKTFKEIQKLAEQYGILTKRGNVRKPRKNSPKQQEQFQKFASRYQAEFGSYSSFKKKQSARARTSYERSLRNRIDEILIQAQTKGIEISLEQAEQQAISELGKNPYSFRKKLDELNELINLLFENAEVSKDARKDLDEMTPLSLDEQKTFITNKLLELNFDLSEYYTDKELEELRKKQNEQ